MRRKKDAELYRIEEEKIKEKKEDIDKGQGVKVTLQQKADDIERKVKFMMKFEAFLEKVKEQHQDEFQELNDILSRYHTLKTANQRL